MAEDLTQETFVAAWSSIDNFAGRSSLVTWLSRIAYRKFVDANRRGLVRAERAKEFHEQYVLRIEEHAAAADLEAAEQHEQVYSALDELNQEDRTILTLHYLQNLSYREMASVLDRPAGTVKWQTSQALQRLRARLNGDCKT
jgi:RNA polymerase sigma-70 factor (ECF subfamily)